MSFIRVDAGMDSAQCFGNQERLTTIQIGSPRPWLVFTPLKRLSAGTIRSYKAKTNNTGSYLFRLLFQTQRTTSFPYSRTKERLSFSERTRSFPSQEKKQFQSDLDLGTTPPCKGYSYIQLALLQHLILKKYFVGWCARKGLLLIQSKGLTNNKPRAL